MSPARATLVIGAAAFMSTVAAPAEAQPVTCGDDGPSRVALSTGLGVAAGATGALTSSGIVSAVDDTRDYEFYVGALVGIGVTTGLSAIYAIYDGSTGCQMANDSALGVVWSVPIVMIILGAALPIAVWGAADEIGAPAPADMEMMAAEGAPHGLSWGLEF